MAWPFLALPPKDRVRVDAFCIGVAKSRSTWLAACLQRHPDVAVSFPKEPNFFVKSPFILAGPPSPTGRRDWAWYATCWDTARPDQVRLDCSVNMFHQDDDVPAAVARAYPDARLLVLLRDPMERVYSHVNHRLQNPRLPPLEMSVGELVTHPEALLPSRYAQHLARWRAHFPRESFLLVRDVDWERDAQATMARVQEHLGVRVVAGLATVPPVQPSLGKGRLYRILEGAARGLRRAGLAPVVLAAKRRGVARAAWNRQAKPKTGPRMPHDLRARVYAELSDDLARLQAEWGIDTAPWTP